MIASQTLETTVLQVGEKRSKYRHSGPNETQDMDRHSNQMNTLNASDFFVHKKMCETVGFVFSNKIR